MLRTRDQGPESVSLVVAVVVVVVKIDVVVVKNVAAVGKIAVAEIVVVCCSRLNIHCC